MAFSCSVQSSVTATDVTMPCLLRHDNLPNTLYSEQSFMAALNKARSCAPGHEPTILEPPAISIYILLAVSTISHEPIRPLVSSVNCSSLGERSKEVELRAAIVALLTPGPSKSKSESSTAAPLEISESKCTRGRERRRRGARVCEGADAAPSCAG